MKTAGCTRVVTVESPPYRACLCMHAIPRNWRKVLVVTSAFHAGRTRAAFEWVWNLYAPGSDGAGCTAERQRRNGEEEAGAAGDDAEGDDAAAAVDEPYIAMDFAVTPDDGLTPEVVAGKEGREGMLGGGKGYILYVSFVHSL